MISVDIVNVYYLLLKRTW